MLTAPCRDTRLHDGEQFGATLGPSSRVIQKAVCIQHTECNRESSLENGDSGSKDLNVAILWCLKGHSETYYSRRRRWGKNVSWIAK
jgi:hypothetical protein